MTEALAARTEILKGFRFAIDPTPAQLESFTRHAGAARWAFNHALGMKVAAHQQWRKWRPVLSYYYDTTLRTANGAAG
ncbi:helix-turn-helix domain-containing protein [Streptomyces umbrinus]|uniref:helix-turn-helix domain-containing protein n=1 Tax=Streptomyces umbrinus TaxID=67370 RepID=UPI0033EC1E31